MRGARAKLSAQRREACAQIILDARSTKVTVDGDGRGEAAHVIMTRVAKWSKLKAWAMNVARRRGAKRAKVALARKLGVVLHRTDFRFGQQAQA